MGDWLLGLGFIMILIMCLMFGPLASAEAKAQDRVYEEAEYLEQYLRRCALAQKDVGEEEE